MRILALVDRYVPAVCAGSEITLHQMLAWFADRGHTATVFTPESDTISKTIDGVNIHLLDKNTLVGGRWDTGESIADTCDVVITQHAYATKAVSMVCDRVPVVFLSHGPHNPETTSKAVGDFSLVVYNSLQLFQQSSFWCPSMVVRPRVDTRMYTTSNAGAVYTTQVNLTEKKGGKLFWMLASHRPTPFLGVEGSYGTQVIRDFANVTVLPPQKSMLDVYANTRVLLMPSSVESFGRVAIEAACSGIPSVLSPTEGLLEAVGKQNALWADPNKLNEWLDALQALDDPDTYKTYSDRARKRAEYLQQRSEVEMVALENALVSIASPDRAKVWVVAQEPQYLEHASPYLHATHPYKRGFLLVPPTDGKPNPTTHAAAIATRCPVLRVGPIAGKRYREDLLNLMGGPDLEGSVCVVVSERDKSYASQIFPRIIRGEHGAGQTYAGNQHHSFAGGPGHNKCESATAPNERIRDIIQNAHRNIRVASIGCPKLFGLHKLIGETKPPRERPRVGFSFRYPGLEDTCAEMGSAYTKYLPMLASLIPEYELGFYCHPRLPQNQRNELSKYGPILSDLWDLVHWADVFCVDNSSVAFEWLYLVRHRLVLLSIDTYRTWMHHGLRFWDAVSFPGVSHCAIPDPDELRSSIVAALQQERSETSVWFDEADLARLGLWLQAHLRPYTVDQPQTQVAVLRSCDGSYGRLRANTTAVLSEEQAKSLCSLGFVEVIPRRKFPDIVQYTHRAQHTREGVELLEMLDWQRNMFKSLNDTQHTNQEKS